MSQAHTTMILCFEPKAARGAVQRALEALGFGGQPDPRWRWFEPGLLTARVAGVVTEETEARLAGMPGIRRVVALAPGRRLVTHGFDRAVCGVTLANGAAFGDGRLGVIAGPCSVEGEAQVCDIAAMVQAAGAKVLRGGVYKPRSSPYSFGGMAERGLECLVRAREKTGLPFATEALEASHLDAVGRHADIIQIGSRNMSNFPLLFQAGAHPSQKPILLKRGFAATIEEFLDAAEYVLLGRICAGAERPDLLLCERGVRTFETSTRFMLDVGAIPVLHERTPLPVIVDPSHAAGARRYVAPLGRAAAAAGADGLLIEVHTDPERAWCDADQCLGPAAFRELMGDLGRLASFAPVPYVGSASISHTPVVSQ